MNKNNVEDVGNNWNKGFSKFLPVQFALSGISCPCNYEFLIDNGIGAYFITYFQIIFSDSNRSEGLNIIPKASSENFEFKFEFTVEMMTTKEQKDSIAEALKNASRSAKDIYDSTIMDYRDCLNAAVGAGLSMHFTDLDNKERAEFGRNFNYHGSFGLFWQTVLGLGEKDNLKKFDDKKVFDYIVLSQKTSREYLANFYDGKFEHDEETLDFYMALNNTIAADDYDTRNALATLLKLPEGKLTKEQESIRNSLNDKNKRLAFVEKYRKSLNENKDDNYGITVDEQKGIITGGRRELSWFMHQKFDPKKEDEKGKFDLQRKILNVLVKKQHDTKFHIVEPKDDLKDFLFNDFGFSDDKLGRQNLKSIQQNYNNKAAKALFEALVDGFCSLEPKKLASLIKASSIDIKKCGAIFTKLEKEWFSEKNKEKVFDALALAAKQTKDLAVYDLISDEKTKKEAIASLNFGSLSSVEMEGFVDDIFRTNSEKSKKNKILLMNIAIDREVQKKEGNNIGNIFAFLAVMSKQNDKPNISYYALIQDKKLKNQALTYRDGFYVKPYVVSAVIVPLAGFGTVGFGIYLNFAKSVPDILNSMASGVKKVVGKMNPIVSILVAVSVPAASFVVFYFLGEKAKQNSKTNRDNKSNIECVRRELGQNQENIK